MKDAFDKNGDRLQTGLRILVPEPNETDLHQCEFAGYVADILDNGNIIAEDQDSDFFEIEAKRVILLNDFNA